MKYRVNKFIAKCGIASRRGAEKLIESGKIKINNAVTKDLSTIIDSEQDVVEFNGEILTPHEIKYYIILNKPKGYITTMSDPFERKCIKSLLPEKFIEAGVSPVGRLDKDTTGLLLLTNDGDTAYKLTHPKYDCEKSYIVQIDNPLEEKHKLKIEKGVYFREFHAKPCRIDFPNDNPRTVKITISEGKKRQIRITFAKFGYKVRKLKRISLGPILLGKLETGMHRRLKKHEEKNLMKYIKNI